MSEKNTWESWNLPPLDDGSRVLPSAEKEAKDRYRSLKQKQADELEKNSIAESIEIVETIDDLEDDNTEEESVEVVEKEQFTLPSAEEIEQLRKSVELEAYAEGFEKGQAHGTESGYKQAYEDTKQSIDQQLQQLKTVTEALLTPLEQQDSAIESILLDSVVTIAKAVVIQEIKTQPEQIVSVVQQAIAALPYGEDKTSILLNPTDIEFIQANTTGDNQWNMVPDSDISAGGCRVTTLDSVVDATVEKRLQSAIDQFLGKELAVTDRAGTDRVENSVDASSPLPREG